jgi:hypothetical protein
VATLPELKEEDGTAAPHWKRNLAVCIFGSFTTIVSLTLVVPFLPLYVEQLGVQGRASMAGTLVGTFGSVPAAAACGAGHLYVG